MYGIKFIPYIGFCDVAVASVMWHLSESAPMCVTNSVTHIGIW
jgi:hypothetical protein